MPASRNDSPAPRSLRIALAVNIAPRKIGSLEDWLLAFARGAADRRHSLTVFGEQPVHPLVLRGLTTFNASWATLGELTQRPLAGIRRLARDFDVFHLNMFGTRDAVPLMGYAAWPIRVLFVDHFSGESATNSPSAVRKALDTLISTRIAGYIGVSNYVRDRARVRFGQAADFAETIHGGIDVDRFTPPLDPRSGPAVGSLASPT
jgi:hypothetical protein